MAAGVHADRFLLTARLPQQIHLLVKSHADLYLDTFPYNSHSTAFEALAVGIPVLTLSGTLVSSRVGASLVHSYGVSPLIVHQHREYIDTAVAVGSNIRLRAGLKTRINQRNSSSTAIAWMKGFEKALGECFEATAASPQSNIMHLVAGA